MADQYTPNYNLVLPEVGSSVDTWGQKLNNDVGSIDGILGSAAGSIVAAMSFAAAVLVVAQAGTLAAAMAQASASAASISAVSANTNANGRVSRTGDTMTGALTGTAFMLDGTASWTKGGGANPVLGFDANCYQIFDRTNRDLAFVIDGTNNLQVGASYAIINSPLTVNTSPTATYHVATKGYVDALASSGTTGISGATGLANNAQASANTALANAATAQNQANVATANAATAQGRADSAWSYADYVNGQTNTKVSKYGDTMTGALRVQNGAGAATATLYLGNGDHYLYFDGGNYLLGNAGLNVTGDVHANAYHGNYLLSYGDGQINGSQTVNGNLSVGGYVGLRGGQLRCDDDGWTRIRYLNCDNNCEAAYVHSRGDINADGNVSAASDARLKSDVRTIDHALAMVNQMRGVRYIMKQSGVEGVGVIAQEIETVLPEVVFEGSNGMKSVAYQNIVGVLIEAIKELSTRCEDLQRQIDDLGFEIDG